MAIASGASPRGPRAVPCVPNRCVGPFISPAPRPASVALRPTACGMASPPVCWNSASNSASCRCCSATPVSAAPRSTHHPHVHCLVTGGGVSPDHKDWIATRPGFFLPVRVLYRIDSSGLSPYSRFAPQNESKIALCRARENSSSRISYWATQDKSIASISSCRACDGYLCGSHERARQFLTHAASRRLAVAAPGRWIESGILGRLRVSAPWVSRPRALPPRALSPLWPASARPSCFSAPGAYPSPLLWKRCCPSPCLHWSA